MVNNAMNIVDVEWEHGETKFLVKRSKLKAVHQTRAQAKLQLLTQFKTLLIIW